MQIQTTQFDLAITRFKLIGTPGAVLWSREASFSKNTVVFTQRLLQGNTIYLEALKIAKKVTELPSFMQIHSFTTDIDGRIHEIKAAIEKLNFAASADPLNSETAKQTADIFNAYLHLISLQLGSGCLGAPTTLTTSETKLQTSQDNSFLTPLKNLVEELLEPKVHKSDLDNDDASVPQMGSKPKRRKTKAAKSADQKKKVASLPPPQTHARPTSLAPTLAQAACRQVKPKRKILNVEDLTYSDIYRNLSSV